MQYSRFDLTINLFSGIVILAIVFSLFLIIPIVGSRERVRNVPQPWRKEGENFYHHLPPTPGCLGKLPPCSAFPVELKRDSTEEGDGTGAPGRRPAILYLARWK